jgi:hypothetical protein
MHRIIFAICFLGAISPATSGEPARSASWRYITHFQGSPIKATQYLEYVGGNFEACSALLAFAKGLNPEFRAVQDGCSIDLPAPSASFVKVDPAPTELFISYEDPALRSRAIKTFTVYHLSAQQVAANGICEQLIAAFHSTQVDARCHAPKTK